MRALDHIARAIRRIVHPFHLTDELVRGLRAIQRALGDSVRDHVAAIWSRRWNRMQDQWREVMEPPLLSTQYRAALPRRGRRRQAGRPSWARVKR